MSNKKEQREILYVEILEAKPNKMFSEAQRQGVRFLRFNRRVACAACGKKVKITWTMLCQFKAGDVSGASLSLQFYPKSFAPLTQVCGDHPIRPDFENDKEEKS